MTALAVPARSGAGRTARPSWTGMMWITWRQHRLALLGVGILLGGCALALGVTGLNMHAAYARLIHSRCPLSGSLVTSRCGVLENAYIRAFYPLPGNASAVPLALSLIPVLVGMFAGAPLLAREYETGTFRFAWTQATSPIRWAVAKLALLGVTLTAAGSAFGALASWWLTQADPFSGGNRWQPAQFGLTAVTFAAWILLAFTLGVFAGALIRRTVPAMAATGLCAVAAAWVTFRNLDGLLVSVTPVSRRVTLLNLAPYQPGSPPVTFVSGQAVTVSAPPGSWPLRSWIAGPRGRMTGYLPQRVLNLAARPRNHWMSSHHLGFFTAYQPAGRFWVFQAAEGDAALLLAVLLGAATVWLVHRRAA